MDIKFLESLPGGVYFVSGIDTNVGKSYATGILARELAAAGRSVITQKLVQTGCIGSSEDIELHRRIMGVAPTREDMDMTTAPEIFTYPCSPHLATVIDGRDIDFARIDAATAVLSERYDIVLLEGAGGLMVPLTDDHRGGHEALSRKPYIHSRNGYSVVGGDRVEYRDCAPA